MSLCTNLFLYIYIYIHIHIHIYIYIHTYVYIYIYIQKKHTHLMEAPKEATRGFIRSFVPFLDQRTQYLGQGFRRLDGL